MIDAIQKSLNWLDERLAGRVSQPGDSRYAAATAIWAKQVGRMPRGVVHCRTPEDIQTAIRAARHVGMKLSVRGGGHDWAGRALCDGLVLDLTGMRSVLVGADNRVARVGGGARAAHVLAVTDPLGVAAVTGAVGAVGITGFALGGGYGALIGRFGLALDNVVAAEVVLADGRIALANDEHEAELFWALRGGGGNFGVVTALHHRLHPLPSVRSGMLLYPFAEARRVLACCAEIAAAEPEDLTVQVGCVVGPDGAPIVFAVPTWCGRPADGEARVAPFLRAGTLLAGSLEASVYGASQTAFDPYIVDGQRALMETCWLPALDGRAVDIFVRAIEAAPSPGCGIFTHEFKGAASRVPVAATAFGLRRDHVLVEILAAYVDAQEEQAHRDWARAALRCFEALALPGGYPNLLGPDAGGRAARSFGPNAARLLRAKRRYDPDNVFRSALPLPDGAAADGVC